MKLSERDGALVVTLVVLGLSGDPLLLQIINFICIYLLFTTLFNYVFIIIIIIILLLSE